MLEGEKCWVKSEPEGLGAVSEGTWGACNTVDLGKELQGEQPAPRPRQERAGTLEEQGEGCVAPGGWKGA